MQAAWLQKDGTHILDFEGMLWMPLLSCGMPCEACTCDMHLNTYIRQHHLWNLSHYQDQLTIAS